MLLGKVVGSVVATQKDEKLSGLKLLAVKYLDLSLKPSGGMVIAADAVGAGVNEIVLTASGSSARLTPATEGKPVDAVIVAIVDELDVDGEMRYRK